MTLYTPINLPKKGKIALYEYMLGFPLYLNTVEHSKKKFQTLCKQAIQKQQELNLLYSFITVCILDSEGTILFTVKNKN